MSDKVFYPPTFAEWFHARLKPDDFSDYSYPEGDVKRYVASGEKKLSNSKRLRETGE